MSIVSEKKFLWGAATAAYQIEGAAAEDGRGPSIWDVFSHKPGKTLNGDTGDVACNHYHRWAEDVALLEELGVSGYRFSVSWSRVLPEGKGRVNAKGLSFYDRLVDALLEKGIAPSATLYHWDLPQALQDRGGWGNRDVVDWFSDYASLLFDALGDRVKMWYTHNEPWVVAYAGHFAGRHAPGLTDLGLAVQVTHHLILSHAGAVAAYRSSSQGDGRIGIVLNLYPTEPASSSPEDVEAARLADEYHNRWFLDPVLKGAYPQGLLETYRKNLDSPKISEGDMAFIASQPVDFLGVNYYFRKVVRHAPVHPILAFEDVKPAGAAYTEMNWEVYPQGLHDLLTRIRDDYANPSVYVTENGAAFADAEPRDGVVQDDDRLAFVKGHVEAAQKCVADGIKLEGYFVWSLLDNFEWAHGYDKRFGLVRVDYETGKRIWKKSGLWYRDFIRRQPTAAARTV